MSTPSFDVVLAGLALVDVIGRPVDFRKTPQAGGLQYIDSITLTTGGNVANCGIDLAKLGFRVAAISRIGNDGLGSFIRQQLSTHSVDLTGVTVDDRLQTSATIVGVRKDGERTFLHTRGALRNFRAADILSRMALIQNAKIFALGYLGLVPECEKEFPTLFRSIKEQSGASILLDTGGTPRRQPALLKKFLPFVDYFIPSFDEAVILTGQKTPEAIVRALYRSGAPGVVGVKLGSKGCYIARGKDAMYIPAVKVRKVVDATGAGDAFVAGFIAAVLRGMETFDAARIANRIASSCVTAVGASTAILPFSSYVTNKP
jgi:sugar/nucleoside kinase (ribokinase family)